MALRANNAVVLGGIDSGGSLLDACFPIGSNGRSSVDKCQNRQVLLRVTLAELFCRNGRSLPWRIKEHDKGQTLVLSDDDALFGSLAVLRRDRALTVLAEPVFCMKSGMPAHVRFDAGEFPTLRPSCSKPNVPAAMAVGFQQYGTDLEITPRVLPDRTLRLTLSIRQSQPDRQSGARINDVVLPGLSTRAAVADVGMASGKTLLLYVPADSKNCDAEAGLLALATARLVRQGDASTYLPAAF